MPPKPDNLQEKGLLVNLASGNPKEKAHSLDLPGQRAIVNAKAIKERLMAAAFPRAKIGDLELSRLIIGTNWFLGYSHCSAAKDALIKERMDSKRIASVLARFLELGVDALYGVRPDPVIKDAIAEAEQKAGRKLVKIAIPSFNIDPGQEASDANARMLDEYLALGTDVCMPHQGTTDCFVDRKARSIAGVAPILKLIRERGMRPGLSTHMPETIVYADAGDLDVETYIQIYNASGFLMQIEVEWVNRIIWGAKKPVIAIKPLAAGRLTPLVGLAFAWSTLRDCDMVCAGVSSEKEAEELVETSLALFERRPIRGQLQTTRSKASLSK